MSTHIWKMAKVARSAAKTVGLWLLVVAACATSLRAQEGEGEDLDAAASPSSIILGKSGPTGALATSQSYLMLQQSLTEGYNFDGLDLEDVDAVFGHVFSKLPDNVTIYPSENYYYWVLYIKGVQVWGNIRLPAGRRERGVLSFGYAEFTEFPSGPGNYLSRSKYFTEGDGLFLAEVDKFTYKVRYNKKEVVFHLHQLSIEPPKQFNLRTNEVFIERTFDESGVQFFLLFNTERNYFFWALNEEERVPDVFTKITDDILVGRRTGYAFWLDGEKRKVLSTVRKISVTRNDYYDGPFDQLADNYVEVNKISKWMERAIPSIKGRIDKYGYYTDVERPSRVALSCYGTYYTQAEIINFIKTAKTTVDPYQYISRGGVPLPGQTNWVTTNITSTLPAAANGKGEADKAIGPKPSSAPKP